MRYLGRLGKKRLIIANIKDIEDKSHKKALPKLIESRILLVMEIQKGLGTISVLTTPTLMTAASNKIKKIALD